MALQHLRSSTAHKRPTPAAMSDGQLAINTNADSPGLFFKDSTGALTKVGPVHVGTTAPNASPASGGETGNTVGEQWLDTTGGTYVFKVWDGSAWRSETGTFVDVNGDTMTGALGIIAGDAATPGLFVSGDTNTGIYSPGADQLAISTNGTGRLFVSSAGLVGIGTSSPSYLLQAAGTIASVNSFGNFAALQTAGGTGFRWTLNNDGTFRLQRTTDAFATASIPILVDSSDRVGIGTTSPVRSLHVLSASSVNTAVFESSGGSSKSFIRFVDSSTSSITNEPFIGSLGDDFAIHTGNAERARIDSSGRLLVGTSSVYNTGIADPKLQVVGTGPTDPAISVSRFRNDAGSASIALFKGRGSAGNFTVINSGDSIGQIQFFGADGTQAVAAAQIECRSDGTPGTNDMPGRLVFSTTADGASSPTARMVILSNGAITFDGTTSTSSTSTGAKAYINSAGVFYIATDDDQPLILNRNTSDGTVVAIRQANNTEGSISVSGTTVSYNGAHLSRWSQLPGIDPYDKIVRPEILRGTVMSNLDEMCDWTCPTSGDCQDNEQLNKTKISDVEGDKNVAGVFQSWDDDDDTWVNDFYLAMTGDFVIRIAAGTTVQRGDLLMSAGDGTAKPQDDDIIRSKTIAKVTSTNVSCTYDDGSYCVPCVLMAC